MGERGLAVDHKTVWRSGGSCGDETCIRVNGEWKWLFRSIDNHGRTIDFLLRQGSPTFPGEGLGDAPALTAHVKPGLWRSAAATKRDDPNVEPVEIIEHQYVKYWRTTTED